jgi:hypothetical protein
MREMVKVLSKQELIDFIYGADIYGTVGGSVSGALANLEEALKKNRITFFYLFLDQINLF